MSSARETRETRETWVPMCPACGCGHLILAAKRHEGDIMGVMCYECKHECLLTDIKFKRL